MKINTTTIGSTSIKPPREDDDAIPSGNNHAEQTLDEALKETFPASDPVAIDITKFT